MALLAKWSLSAITGLIIDGGGTFQRLSFLTFYKSLVNLEG